MDLENLGLRDPVDRAGFRVAEPSEQMVNSPITLRFQFADPNPPVAADSSVEFLEF